MNFPQMAQSMMPSFENYATNFTRKIQGQVSSLNVFLKICSLRGFLAALCALPTLMGQHSGERGNLLIYFRI